MSSGRVVAIVVGAVLAVTGLAALVGGATLGWAVATQRDDDGFFTTSEERLASDGYAITSERIDLGDPGPDDWWADRELVTVRLTVTAGPAEEVFVGIGPESEVEAYLDDVPHDEVVDVQFAPFSVEYRREHPGGAAVPTPPGDRDLWVAQAAGPGTQVVTWDLEPGDWAIVLMDAEGARGVVADVEVGGRVDLLGPLAVGLAAGGLVLAASGVAVVVAAAVRRPASQAVAHPAAVPLLAPVDTPVRLEGRLDEPLSRWLWLVKWFLAIPHFVVLAFLWLAFVFTTLVAFVAILFTARYPRSIFDFNVGVLRWTWRVGFYATSAIGTDRYPPFTLGPAAYPATLDVAYPGRLSRGLVLVKSWLLAIPHLVLVGLVVSSPGVDGDGAGGVALLFVLVVIAGGGLLVTGHYPRGLFDLLVGVNRWLYRVIAYVALMTDRYPPFRLDQGPGEHPAADASPPGPPPPPTAPPSGIAG